MAAVAPVPADTSSALSVSGGQAHRHMVTRTMRSQDIKDEIHSRATEKALNYGFRGALIGIATTFLLSKSSAWFDRRPRVFKTIFALVFPMVGFTVGGEHEALRLERELAYEKSYVKVAGIPGMPTPEPSALEEELAAIRAGQAPLVTADSLKNYVVENQFKLLFSLWGSLVSSSLIYLLANQKMVSSQRSAKRGDLSFDLSTTYTPLLPFPSPSPKKSSTPVSSPKAAPSPPLSASRFSASAKPVASRRKTGSTTATLARPWPTRTRTPCHLSNNMRMKHRGSAPKDTAPVPRRTM